MTDKSNTPAELKDAWRTPPEIFEALNCEFQFFIDAAASESNALCADFITEKQNTLETDWGRDSGAGCYRYAWLNPPYSNVRPFVKKAVRENSENRVGCVMLLNADTSVGWFSEAIKTAHEVRFITGGRLAFLSGETGKPVPGNNKGQMLIIWHPCQRGGLLMTTVERDYLMRKGAELIAAKQ